MGLGLGICFSWREAPGASGGFHERVSIKGKEN